MPRFSYIHSLATEAFQEVYRQDDHELYGESEILRRPLETGSDYTPALRIPLGLMGRFRVGEDGIVSAFVSNAHDQASSEAFGLANVQDCVRAGQYLLQFVDYSIEFGASEAETFAVKIEKAEDDLPVNLLAGIQVSYEVDREDLVPTLVYNRSLGNIVFSERSVIAGHLLATGGSFAEVAGQTCYETDGLARAVMNPTEKNVDFFAEAAAQAIVREMPVDIPASGSL